MQSLRFLDVLRLSAVGAALLASFALGSSSGCNKPLNECRTCNGDRPPPPATSGGFGVGGSGPMGVAVRTAYQYRDGRPRFAVLMSDLPLEGSRVSATDGTTLSVGSDLGAWNATWRHVASVDLGPLAIGAGIAVQNAQSSGGTTPVIDDAATYAGVLLSGSLAFFSTQRDGLPSDVALAIPHEGFHANDAQAQVYAPPSYAKDAKGKLRLVGDLQPLGATIDAGGGWMNGATTVKYVATTSFAVLPMLIAERDGMLTPTDATQGLQWLDRMWDDATSTLYYQVGLARGSDAIAGDRDVWRSPSADDTPVPAGAREHYLYARPVFRAGPPGSKLSPNLAGRLAAAFALCAQVYKTLEPPRSSACLLHAEHVLALADTSPSGELLTTSPHEDYPEVEWRDDLELGAAEIAIALALGATAPNLPITDASTYLDQALQWSRAYRKSANAGARPLGVFDVAALAHRELWYAAKHANPPRDLSADVPGLLADLELQIAPAIASAKSERFGSGVPLGTADVVPRSLALAIEASIHDELVAGAPELAVFQERQIEYVLGVNPWGVSFFGVSGDSPSCPYHPMANLMSSAQPIAGAILPGPVSPKIAKPPFPQPDGLVPCSSPVMSVDADRFDVAFADDPANSASGEPTIEDAALAYLAFTR